MESFGGHITLVHNIQSINTLPTMKTLQELIDERQKQFLQVLDGLKGLVMADRIAVLTTTKENVIQDLLVKGVTDGGFTDDCIYNPRTLFDMVDECGLCSYISVITDGTTPYPVIHIH